jgi:putative transposase
MTENKRYKGKPYSSYRLYNLLQRIRNGSGRFGRTLRELDTSAIQNITERVDRAYKLFFTKLKKGERKLEPVKTKSPLKYPSFTIKKAGKRFDWMDRTVTLYGRRYKFFDDDVPTGKLKTITVKRDALGDTCVFVVCDEVDDQGARDPRPIVGIDVWLDPLMVLSDGTSIDMPTFYKDKLRELKKMDKAMSHKREAAKKKPESDGSKTAFSHKYKRLKAQRARLFKHIANKRKEHHIQLARDLSQKYGTIALPDVPVSRLQRLSGLKVSDLAYSAFLGYLEQQCHKTGTRIIKIPARPELARTCHLCGNKTEKFPRSDWTCPECGAFHKLSRNISKNIEKKAVEILESEITG